MITIKLFALDSKTKKWRLATNQEEDKFIAHLNKKFAGDGFTHFMNAAGFKNTYKHAYCMKITGGTENGL